jgi:hypothetical protein
MEYFFGLAGGREAACFDAKVRTLAAASWQPKRGLFAAAASCYIVRADMSEAKSPLDRLDRQELLWLTAILKDACRERLEKNLVTQEFEERLYKRGPVKGRLDPRPFLKVWEPRYRKFLEVATDLLTALEAEDAKAVAESLRGRFAQAPARRGAALAQVMIEKNAANPRRKSRSR